MNHAPLTYDEIEAAISAAIAERDTTIAELRAALNEAAHSEPANMPWLPSDLSLIARFRALLEGK